MDKDGSDKCVQKASRPLAFANAVKKSSLTKTAKKRIARTQMQRRVCKLAVDCRNEQSAPVITVETLLAGPYSYASTAAVLEDFHFPTIDVSAEPEIRLRKSGEEVEELKHMLPVNAIESAVTSISSLSVELSTSKSRFVACWPECGSITIAQLKFMLRFAIACSQFEDVQVVLAWIEHASWEDCDVERVQNPFGDLRRELKESCVQGVMNLNMREILVANEATDASQLFCFRDNEWLNTTSIITTMKALSLAYIDVVVVSPSFFEYVGDVARQQKIANAYKAFSPVKASIIGAWNIGNNHWIVFHIDTLNQVCRLCDPLQKPSTYDDMEKIMQSVMKPLLGIEDDLAYVRFDPFRQQDGSSCGVWCLVMLELALANRPWDHSLYALIPYLRLRYLRMAIDFIEEKSDNGVLKTSKTEEA